MRTLLCTGFALAAALSTLNLAAAQSSGGAMSSSMKSMSSMAAGHAFKISAQNGSGESGTATLTQTSGGLLVKLSLTGGSGDQPAHIHTGTCANLNPKPAYPLTTVMAGASTTTIKGLTLSTLTSGTYAINVHKSTTDLKDYVACGNITVANEK